MGRCMKTNAKLDKLIALVEVLAAEWEAENNG
jgi:hypothetical protein